MTTDFLKNNGKKNVVVLLFLSLAIFIGIKFCFPYIFGKKISRESLTEYFVTHEEDFLDIATSFNRNCKNIAFYQVELGKGSGNTISLSLYPNIIDSNTRILGGENLKFGSTELDTVLRVLGWNEKLATELRDKLAKTNCDWIRTTDNNLSPIVMYPKQNDWGAYSYVIYNEIIPDSINSELNLGTPISNSQFGKRVHLNYVSAL